MIEQYMSEERRRKWKGGERKKEKARGPGGEKEGGEKAWWLSQRSTRAFDYRHLDTVIKLHAHTKKKI